MLCFAKTMSEDNLPHISYGLDSRGRIVRIESGITRANIRRLPSIEEALRRFSTNLRVDRQVNDSNGNLHTLHKILQSSIHKLNLYSQNLYYSLFYSDLNI